VTLLVCTAVARQLGPWAWRGFGQVQRAAYSRLGAEALGHLGCSAARQSRRGTQCLGARAREQSSRLIQLGLGAGHRHSSSWPSR